MGKLRWFVVMFVLLALLSSGCNNARNERRGRGDAPVGTVDDTPKDVIQFPDRFSNVSHACDGHGHRVYVTTQTDSGRFMWVVTDKSCPGGQQ